MILVSITGHLGGNLTHGSDYLIAYAPNFIKKLVGAEVREFGNGELPLQPDSIIVFEHLVQPILESKCISCHNASKTQGGLLLTVDGLKEGGSSGASFHAGKPMESELFVRTTLPQSSKKFMPPKGEPLSYTELKLIEWWISEGASFDASLTEVNPSKKIEKLLLRDYGIDTNPKPYYDLVQTGPIEKSLMEELSKAGWKIIPLAADHPMLEVTFTGKELTSADLNLLKKAVDNITWMDLSGIEISDDALASIADFKNLTRLDLSKSKILNKELDYLNELTHLEILNLHSTPVTDEVINSLTNLKSLKKVFIWQTEISQEGIENLEVTLPKTEIVSGISTSVKS